MRKIIILLFLSVIFSQPGYTQDLRQIIKGKVTDRETGMPLAGAYILENGPSPSNGTTTDTAGNFRQGYLQWKTRLVSGLEINSGFHIISFSLNREIYFEPRFGLRWQITPGSSFIAGFGLHSRIESLSVYNALIKNSSWVRTTLNHELGLSRSVHKVFLDNNAGYSECLKP
jgi:hypothetical protein